MVTKTDSKNLKTETVPERKRFSDLQPHFIGEPLPCKFSEIIKSEYETFEGKDILIRSVCFREGKMKDGKKDSDYAQIVYSCISDDQKKISSELFTTYLKGEVVLRKLRQAADEELYPIIGKCTKKQGSQHEYYDID